MPFPTTSLAGRYEARLETGLADNDVATFTDQSGNARHLASILGTPKWRTAIINGHAVYRFDGTDDSAAFTYGALQADAAQTISVVAASGAAEATTREWLFGVYDATTAILGLTEADPTSNEWGSFTRSTGGGGGTGKIGTGGDNTVTPAVLTLSWDQTNGRFYRNGTLIGTTSSLAGALQIQTIMLGGHPTLGEYYAGDVALAAYWRKALDATERSSLHSYVQDTYAISVSDYSAGGSSISAAAAMLRGGRVGCR